MPGLQSSSPVLGSSLPQSFRKPECVGIPARKLSPQQPSGSACADGVLCCQEMHAFSGRRSLHAVRNVSEVSSGSAWANGGLNMSGFDCSRDSDAAV